MFLLDWLIKLLNRPAPVDTETARRVKSELDEDRRASEALAEALRKQRKR